MTSLPSSPDTTRFGTDMAQVCCNGKGGRQGPVYDEHEVCLIIKRAKRPSTSFTSADPEDLRNLYLWEPQEGRPSTSKPNNLIFRGARRRNSLSSSANSSRVKRVTGSTNASTTHSLAIEKYVDSVRQQAPQQRDEDRWICGGSPPPSKPSQTLEMNKDTAKWVNGITHLLRRV